MDKFRRVSFCFRSGNSHCINGNSFSCLLPDSKKAFLFLLSIGGVFFISFIIYQFIPNPYEFTHLPEYAVLSVLVIWALGKEKSKSPYVEKEKRIGTKMIENPYFLSALITGTIGTTDEIYQHFLPTRHFTWYDICLNILGGILGLLIFWGIKKNKVNI